MKLNVKDLSSVEAVIVNGAECEPYITSDTRTMLDHPDLVAEGVALLQKYLGAKRVIIAIEDNKPQCIRNFRETFKGDSGVEVTALPAMAVKEDERFPAIRECLPGANCGACGYAGCDGYARALLTGDVKTNLCVPGADGAAQKLSALMGVACEDVQEQVAFMQCSGDCNATSSKMDYHGIESCTAAKLLFGGAGKCSFGCLGFGDCVKTCPYGALSIQNGIAHGNEFAAV